MNHYKDDTGATLIGVLLHFRVLCSWLCCWLSLQLSCLQYSLIQRQSDAHPRWWCWFLVPVSHGLDRRIQTLWPTHSCPQLTVCWAILFPLSISPASCLSAYQKIKRWFQHHGKLYFLQILPYFLSSTFVVVSYGYLIIKTLGTHWTLVLLDLMRPLL